MRVARWFYKLPLRMRSLFRRKRVEGELDEELQYHVERQIEENIAKGFPPDEARYAAIRAFGNTTGTKENLREIAGWTVVEALVNDVRYGLRLLRRTPVFAVFAIASLSLGIGAAGSIFSLLNAIALRDLPVRNPEQLISLYMTIPGRSPNWSLPYPQFEAMRARNTTLDGLTAVSAIDRVSVSAGNEPQLAVAEAVSGDYYQMLGLQPALGRLLTPAADKAGNAIAVISHGYWQRRFGGSLSVIGSSIRINEEPFTIVGVAPEGFAGLEVGRRPDITVPLHARSGFWNEAFATWLYVLGRLKPGESFNRAQQELDFIFREVSQEAAASAPPQERDPAERLARDVGLKIESGSKGTVSGLREGYRAPLQLLLGLIGAVLCMASLNVGTLVLSRSRTRQKEIATRLALGAGRGRLIRQLLVESIVLSAIASGLALLAASSGSHFLFRMAMPAVTEIPVDLSLDGRVIFFTMTISVLTCLIFGLLPAIRATSPQRANLSARQAGVTLERTAWDRVLVGSQVALSLVVLIAAGLFARSLQSLWARDTGYDRENILMFSLDATLAGRQPGEAGNAYKSILRELQSLPSVQAATVSVVRPVTADFYLVDMVSQIGERVLASDQRIRVAFDNVAPGYFSTLRIPMLAGREFQDQDELPASRTVIISETLARRRFPNENPIGQFMSMGRDRRQIIGVAADVRYANVKDAPREVVYRPIFQAPGRFHVSFQVRYRGATEEALRSMREVLGRTEPALAMFNVKTLAAQTAESFSRERLLAVLSSYFGAFALLLTCLGLYGLLNYSVIQRTPEVGLRIALGANRWAVQRMVLRESLATVALGGIAGIAGALAVTRLLENQLFGVAPHDPIAFGGATLVLMIVGFIASMIPATRASKIDPIAALKYE